MGKSRTPGDPWLQSMPKVTWRPLFLIHAAEGNVLLYRNFQLWLAARGVTSPCTVMQAAEGLDGKSPLDAQFEHVASRLCERDPAGAAPRVPICLARLLPGGTIAM